MIGLGVGIDYALFIVTRYREDLHLGMDPEAATVNALGTAGRAVLFAGHHRRHLAARHVPDGAGVHSWPGHRRVLTVLTTLVASLTLLPALLGFAETSDRGHPVAWACRRRSLVAIALFFVGLHKPTRSASVSSSSPS